MPVDGKQDTVPGESGKIIGALDLLMDYEITRNDFMREKSRS